MPLLIFIEVKVFSDQDKTGTADFELGKTLQYRFWVDIDFKKRAVQSISEKEE